MPKLPWYKRYPDAALAGMMQLSLEQRGVFNTILDLFFLRVGNLPDDDRFVARWCGVDIRVYRRIKESLVELDKIQIVDGQIHNRRADVELQNAQGTRQAAREAGRRSGVSRRAKSKSEVNNNNRLGRTGVRANDKRTRGQVTTLEARIAPDCPVLAAKEWRRFIADLDAHNNPAGAALANCLYDGSTLLAASEARAAYVRNNFTTELRVSGFNHLEIGVE